jgi:hypothetical protein
VIDRDAEIAGDRGDQILGTVVQGGVDLADRTRHAVGRQGDEEVPRDRQQRGRALGRVEVQHHRHVAAGTTHLLGAAEQLRILGGKPGPRVVAHDQDVLGGFLGGGGGSQRLVQVDLRHLFESPVGVGIDAGGAQGGEHHQRQAGGDGAALPEAAARQEVATAGTVHDAVENSVGRRRSLDVAARYLLDEAS